MLARLTGLVNAMVRNPVLQTGLQQVLGFTRSEFKEHSNRGFVWTDRHLVDLGNYRYAVVYHFLWRFARHNRLHALTFLFDSLSDVYTSLELKADFTYHSLEMKGDVIECVLADCLLTGPAIESETRRNRREFNDRVVEFYETLERLINMTYNGDDGWGWPVPSKHFVDPDIFVKILCGAQAAFVIQNPDVRANVIRNFEQATQVATSAYMNHGEII